MNGTLYTREIGDVYIEVDTFIDESPDYSYLGRYCNWEPPKNGEYLYHLDSGAMMDSTGTWRDSKGHYCGIPIYTGFGYFPYAMVGNNGQDCLRHIAEDGERLRRFGNGDLYYMVIHAKLYHHGVLISEDYCGGFESDSDPKYLVSQAREMAQGLLHNATHCVTRRGN